MPFANWKTRSKYALTSTTRFPSNATAEENAEETKGNYPRRQNSSSTNSSHTMKKGSRWQAGMKKYNCFDIHQCTKQKKKKTFQIVKEKKKGTISLSLFNNGLIFILRWISNYYFLSSFLLDGVHLYFGFSSWQMQTNVIWIANTKTIYITAEKLMPRLGMELHWDRACQRARSPESWVQSSAPPRHPSTLETEAEGLEVQDHFWIHREFEASLGYIRPCL